jgi:hypothetical protein
MRRIQRVHREADEVGAPARHRRRGVVEYVEYKVCAVDATWTRLLLTRRAR